MGYGNTNGKEKANKSVHVLAVRAQDEGASKNFGA